MLDLLQNCGLRRERFPVLADNAYFFPVEPGELYIFSEQSIFFVLVRCRERVLMDDYHVGLVTTRAGEVRQQALNRSALPAYLWERGCR
jgi:hypothetical protein